MFNLEQSITGWRRQMAVGGVKSPAVLDELESHLWEEIRVQMAGGVSEREAFETAVARIGSAKSVRTEFDKIQGSTCLPVVIAVSVWAVLVAGFAFFVLRKMAGGHVDALLGAHCFTILTGFLGAFVAGSLGVCYLCWHLFGTLSSERSSSVRKAAAVFTRISLAFMGVGFLLGLLWASKHGGAYWMGSLMEIGELCTILWLVVLALVQRFRRIGDDALMLLCAGSNVVVAMSWFGMGTLSAELRLAVHCWPLEIFVTVFAMIHLLLLAMSFRRGLKPVES